MEITLDIRRGVDIQRTARVMQMEGMFDVPPAERSEQFWRHHFVLPEDWNIGAIVGPSGSGKSTLSREAFAAGAASQWPEDKSILDGFPDALGIKQITGLLCSVGFSSPPSWLRPYRVLSTGEQFRVDLARTLADCAQGGAGRIAVVDEFTSVVDRTVARIGSAAVAKAVRRGGQRFIAVTCHYDVLDWLEPDWVYEPHLGKLTINELDSGRRRLWRRPPIDLVVRRVHYSAWRLFRQHHYLSGDLHRSARCFAAMAQERPAAFAAVLSFPHPRNPGWREHRLVCLPDFQGVGIGNALSEYVASLYAASGKPYFSTTSHPAMIRHRARSPLWRMVRAPSMTGRHGGRPMASSFGRLTAGFRYVGPARLTEAKGSMVI